MEPNTPSQPTPPMAPETQIPVTQSIPSSPNVPSSKTKYILLGVLILLIIVAVGGGSYYLGIVKQKPVVQKNNNVVAAITTPIPTSTATPTTISQPTLSPVATAKSNPSVTPDSTANWKIFNSTSGKFSFKYPFEWNSASGGSLITGTETDSFGPKVSSSSEDLNSKLTIQMQHPSESTGVIDAKTYINIDSSTKGILPTNYVVDGINTYRLSYLNTGTGFDEVVLNRNNIIYVLNFGEHGVSTISNSNKNLFNQILSTFKFTQ